MYTHYFANYVGLHQEVEDHYGDPHSKRALRVQARNELHETGLHARRLWLRSVLYKLKKDEIAKPGKRGRGIGDLGVAASLQGFRSTYLLKCAMSDCPLVYKGFTIFFCKSPSYQTMKWVFEQLRTPPGRGFFVYFSDDSCLAYNTPSGVVRVNIDIKSCDASHTSSLFDAAVAVTPTCARDDVLRLVEQCSLPIKIQEVRHGPGKRNKVKLAADGPTLYSGSTLTTYINGIASIMIACSIADVEEIKVDKIPESTKLAGYDVTCDICHTFEEVQFLKHSPVEDVNGVYQPVLNLGVFLRASGTCHGDLPGRGNIAVRARSFQAGLLQGIYPRVHSPFLEALRTAYGRVDPTFLGVVKKLYEYKVDQDAPELHFTDSSLFHRYRLREGRLALSDSDVLQFTSTFSRATVSHHYCDKATDVILLKDYGLSSDGVHSFENGYFSASGVHK